MAISEATLLRDSTLERCIASLQDSNAQRDIREFFVLLETLAAKARGGSSFSERELVFVDALFSVIGRGLGTRERVLIAVDALSGL
jgi:hypothetical protein